jgi:hypothetical protein
MARKRSPEEKARDGRAAIEALDYWRRLTGRPVPRRADHLELPVRLQVEGKTVLLDGKPISLERGEESRANALSLLPLINDVLANAPGPDAGATVAPVFAPPKGIIWSLGECRYQVGERKILVSEKEDNVLEAFLEQEVHSTCSLKNASGEDNAARLLRALRTKYQGVFKDVIANPGRKGTGGYVVKVRPAPAH